jgi:hypothetical protein
MGSQKAGLVGDAGLRCLERADECSADDYVPNDLPHVEV